MEFNHAEAIIAIKNYWKENRKDIKIGLLDEKSQKFIEEKLHLKELTEIQLENIYDFVSTFFTTAILTKRMNQLENNKITPADTELIFTLHDCASATKHLIMTHMREKVE